MVDAEGKSALGRKQKLVTASVTRQEAVEFAALRPLVTVIFKTSHLFREVTPLIELGTGAVTTRFRTKTIFALATCWADCTAPPNGINKENSVPDS
jgi:hypothetical protein